MNTNNPQITHISTTHNERYYHVTLPASDSWHEVRGTVFFRQWEPRAGKPPSDMFWASSWAVCSHGDQFNKKIGRTVARRRYFEGDSQGIFGEPSYEKAVDLIKQITRLLNQEEKAA